MMMTTMTTTMMMLSPCFYGTKFTLKSYLESTIDFSLVCRGGGPHAFALRDIQVSLVVALHDKVATRCRAVRSWVTKRKAQ
jgi:hypothetical protein